MAAYLEVRPLDELLKEAQGLLAHVPVPAAAYVAWRLHVHESLTERFGANSAIVHRVHEGGILPTSFFDATIEEVRSRLDKERPARLANMAAMIGTALGS